ncbi:glyoxalase [Microbacterium murale]|uniref:Lactoylglutathione lyase n=1 Tax=Microbacterium murale TaxID=1081040 RepID=A0ABU0PBD4_9MICO|nr:glyoxalase [Microbacterium murale]MDQ0644658.1 putative lactoylglutathione lyase [Microbacterium murale]
MNTIDTITLEVSDLSAAEAFYAQAFSLGDRLRLRQSDDATSGFRGYTLSLIVSQPANAQLLLDDAIAAGAAVVKPAAKSLWGFGGAVQAPDGAVWNIATSSKKDTAAPSRTIDSVVLLLGVDDVKASKAFYVERGVPAGKSFGSYVDFKTAEGSIGLGLYKRAALAKSVNVPSEGSGSHRIRIQGALGEVTAPDGFRWEQAV